MESFVGSRHIGNSWQSRAGAGCRRPRARPSAVPAMSNRQEVTPVACWD